MVLSDTSKIGRVSGHGVTRFACVSVGVRDVMLITEV